MDSKKSKSDLDSLHIELNDMQKCLSISSKTCRQKSSKMTKIFSKIRKLLNIKQNDSGKKETLDI